MVAYLGGKCVKCGVVSGLEIDHIDPSTKVAPVTQMWNKSWDKIEFELKKCQLLCGPHHLEKTLSEGSHLKGIKYGEANHASKLTADSVDSIRKAYVSGASLNHIMRLFPKLHKSTIFRVIQNKTWTDPNYTYVRN